MSTALYIVPERDTSDIDCSVSGKALGSVDDTVIDKLCEHAGTPSLYEFSSHNPEETAALLEELGEEVPDDLPETHWFDANEGLTTVQNLMLYLDSGQEKLKNRRDLIEDLKGFERVLSQLAEHDIRWYLAIDF
jgi:hypothetical protein